MRGVECLDGRKVTGLRVLKFMAFVVDNAVKEVYKGAKEDNTLVTFRPFLYRHILLLSVPIVVRAVAGIKSLANLKHLLYYLVLLS